MLSFLVGVFSHPPSTPVQWDDGPLVGYYGAVGGTVDVDNFDFQSQSTFSSEHADRIAVSNAFGVTAKIGYNINHRFAVEFDVLFSNDFSVDGDRPTLSEPMRGSLGEINGNIFSENLKSYFANREASTSRLQPYGLGGIGYGIFDTTSFQALSTLSQKKQELFKDIMLHGGIGVEYLLTKNFALYTELSYYFWPGDLDDMSLIPITAGIQYTF